MSIDGLPNELLTLILHDEEIPLQERIKLRAVSSRWLTVIEEGLKKQAKLVLNDNHQFRASNANDLVVLNAKHFNGQLLHQLARLFPSISQLSIAFSSTQYFDQLPDYLLAYSTTLKSFSLNSDNLQLSIQTRTRLIKVISTLVNLTSLKFLSAIDLDEQLVTLIAPTLTRLEQFSFVNYGFEYGCLLMLPGALFQRIVGHLSDRCTSLNCSVSHSDWLVIDKLTSLTSLTINFRCFIATYLSTDILGRLSALHQLTELCLTGLFYDPNVLKRPREANHSLTSVKKFVFDLNSFCNFDGNYFCSTIAAWFPRLEQLKVKGNRKYETPVRENLNAFQSSVTFCFEERDEMPLHIHRVI